MQHRVYCTLKAEEDLALEARGPFGAMKKKVEKRTTELLRKYRYRKVHPTLQKLTDSSLFWDRFSFSSSLGHKHTNTGETHCVKRLLFNCIKL